MVSTRRSYGTVIDILPFHGFSSNFFFQCLTSIRQGSRIPISSCSWQVSYVFQSDDRTESHVYLPIQKGESGGIKKCLRHASMNQTFVRRWTARPRRKNKIEPYCQPATLHSIMSTASPTASLFASLIIRLF